MKKGKKEGRDGEQGLLLGKTSLGGFFHPTTELMEERDGVPGAGIPRQVSATGPWVTWGQVSPATRTAALSL